MKVTGVIKVRYGSNPSAAISGPWTSSRDSAGGGVAGDERPSAAAVGDDARAAQPIADGAREVSPRVPLMPAATNLGKKGREGFNFFEGTYPS